MTTLDPSMPLLHPLWPFLASSLRFLTSLNPCTFLTLCDLSAPITVLFWPLLALYDLFLTFCDLRPTVTPHNPCPVLTPCGLWPLVTCRDLWTLLTLCNPCPVLTPSDPLRLLLARPGRSWPFVARPATSWPTIQRDEEAGTPE